MAGDREAERQARATRRAALRAEEAAEQNKSPQDISIDEMLQMVVRQAPSDVDIKAYLPTLERLLIREAAEGSDKSKVRMNSFNPATAVRGPGQFVARTAIGLSAESIDEYNGKGAKEIKALFDNVRLSRDPNNPGYRRVRQGPNEDRIDAENAVARQFLYNPEYHAFLIGRNIREIQNQFRERGIENPTPGQVYAAWFSGPGTAANLIRLARANPNAPAIEAWPERQRDEVLSKNKRELQGKTAKEVVAIWENDMASSTSVAETARRARGRRAGLKDDKTSNPFMTGTMVPQGIMALLDEAKKTATPVRAGPPMSRPSGVQTVATGNAMRGPPAISPVLRGRMGDPAGPVLAEPPAPGSPSARTPMSKLPGFEFLGQAFTNQGQPNSSLGPRIGLPPAPLVSQPPQPKPTVPIQEYSEGGVVTAPVISPPTYVNRNGVQLSTGFVPNDNPVGVVNQQYGPPAVTASQDTRAQVAAPRSTVGLVPPTAAASAVSGSFNNFNELMDEPDQRWRGQNINAFEVGGEVGPGGMNMNMLDQGQAQPMGNALESEVDNQMQANPQAVAQIREAILQAVQSGELTQQELNYMSQLVQTVAKNPDSYPALRNYVVSQDPELAADLPQEYDEGLVSVLLVAVKAVQTEASKGLNTTGAPATKNGGALPTKSPNEDGAVPIIAHEGEFVIPANVVRAKGTEFFQKMIERYDENGKEKPSGA